MLTSLIPLHNTIHITHSSTSPIVVQIPFAAEAS